MQNVTKAGPQRPACVLDDCTEPPVRGEVYCQAHLDWYNRQNGTAATPPIIEPDDPELLEREARKAAALEEEEYRERRRVKTWKTLEDGRRIPEEYWSDAELAAIEAEAERNVRHIGGHIAMSHEGSSLLLRDRDLGAAPPVDPAKAAAKLFRRALRGRYGQVTESAAWAFVAMLEER